MTNKEKREFRKSKAQREKGEQKKRTVWSRKTSSQSRTEYANKNPEKIKNMNYRNKNYKDYCKRTGIGKRKKEVMSKSQLIFLHPEWEHIERN